MNLIESVLSIILISTFFSIFVSAITPILKIEKENDKIEKEYNRDKFIFESFMLIEKKIDKSNETIKKIEDWKCLVENLYPTICVYVEKIGVKDSRSLYKATWSNKSAYLKIDEGDSLN